jgi:hypothetical protein
MKKLIIVLCAVLLSSCSAEDRAALESAMDKPAREMDYGEALLLVVIGALLAHSSCRCKHNNK